MDEPPTFLSTSPRLKRTHFRMGGNGSVRSLSSLDATIREGQFLMKYVYVEELVRERAQPLHGERRHRGQSSPSFQMEREVLLFRRLDGPHRRNGE
ncbi:hypothetical protein CEXT_485561 [Caerostris extrusa]|uniref:Uncharacterized protein n=1 Tax=Caerostris extrusa TaxID=172846 RepID=A0AAV4VYB5_CAEEX|nr:hypothetical protein CEXT_485561 [Caerostris extrusa]